MISNADNLGATPIRGSPRTSPPSGSLPDGGRRRDRGRPQGRAHRPASRRRAAGPARDRSDAARGRDSFRDYRRWRYYNTNNLWVDLRALARALEEPAACSSCRSSSTARPSIPRDSARLRCSSSRAQWARRSSASPAPDRLRAAHAIRAGQDDRRPAAPALGRLQAYRSCWSSRPERAGASRSSSSIRASTSCSTTSRHASRGARRRCAMPSD